MLLRFQKFTNEAALRCNVTILDEDGGTVEVERTVTDPSVVAQAEALAAAIEAVMPAVRAAVKAENAALVGVVASSVQPVGLVG